MILNGPGISYTEPDIGAEFVPPIPEHPREAIVKLCEHCTNRLLHRDELLGYEYWSFAEAATDEQAEVLCKMKMRRPYTLPEMVKLTGMPEADIEKMLDDMSYTGLLEYNWENPERAKQWVLPMLVPGSAEFLNMRVGQLEEHPVYAKFFEQASKGPLSKATPMVPPGGAGIGMHVIPVEKAIDAASTSVPIEHIEHWLDKYEGKYAASTCSCRASRRVMGEGCADDPADWCIAVGDMADYVVETDRGHYVTRDEVYDILRDEYDIQIEFGDIGNILAYLSIGDRPQEVERLVSALAEIKRRYSTDGTGLLSQEYIDPEVAASPQEAFYAPKKSLPLRETEGMVCSEFVMCYPPGIPILAPGERITAEILDYIEYAKAKGCSMTGPEDPDILRLNVLA